MAIFVNREEELLRINEGVTTLLDESRLLRTPIIEFYGIGGIGKTALLQKIEQDFKVRVHCIVGNAKDINTQSLAAAISEAITKNAGVAIILDALEAADEEQLQNIGGVLGQFINSVGLFVILASREQYQFSETRSIARKIHFYPLKPLEQQHCEAYMSQAYNTIDPYIQKKIFEWTRGYPLAMSIMADVLHKKQFNFKREQDQKQLLSIIIEKVVDQNLLVRVGSDSAELSRFHAILNVLCVARRPHIVLIQHLIERFAPEYKLSSGWAYRAFPPSIMKVTSAFKWNQERGGYCIDGSIRNLFLLRDRIEQPQLYIEMHKFLAKENENFARQVMNGPDHTRYLREFFYHLAHCEAEAHVREQLVQHIEQLMPKQVASDPIFSKLLDDFLQFYEEFQQDEELKEVLKLDNVKFALSLMRQKFLEVYRHLPAGMRGKYLQNFFVCTSLIVTYEGFTQVFEAGMDRMMREEAIDVLTVFKDVLLQDQTLRDFLGNDFERMLLLLADSLSEER